MTENTAPVAEPTEDGSTAGAAAARRGRLRRIGFAVGRWAAAVAVCAGAATGVAYGLAGMERHDVPGLATEPDGRWEYPRLSLPALPVDVPRPYSDGNYGQLHHADLRRLLLPAPGGATADKELTGGWVPVDRYLAEYEEGERAKLRQALTDHGVRHVAARGWTMPDGTSTRIYLLQFDSTAFTRAYQDWDLSFGGAAGTPLMGAPDLESDPDWVLPDQADTSSYVFREKAPHGPEQTRQAYIVAGDTLGLVVQSRKGTSAPVPFHQTVVLQKQLLG
ncbi:hypothetical protein J5J01_09800 [Streptomyces fradiae]|uniref:hypothetical protein n=1 Tax=Streptomyces fradiae TaxID=1906 RepID=UPI002019859B|nr:hypothetical protein [Streptomyces fradiae]UQS31849.1 hypothetical protein J5J01_09800 [Streptomyces fradiae]